jgi:hypothetical protein
VDQPFNWYHQDYQDIKDVNERILQQYLPQVCPFKGRPTASKYPYVDIYTRQTKPRWNKYEQELFRRRKNQYSLIPFKYSNMHDEIENDLKNLPYQQTKQDKI